MEREEEGGLSGSSVCTERRKKQEGDLYTGQRVKLAQPLSLEDSLHSPLESTVSHLELEVAPCVWVCIFMTHLLISVMSL